jgi:hypothetical protein
MTDSKKLLMGWEKLPATVKITVLDIFRSKMKSRLGSRKYFVSTAAKKVPQGSVT